MSQLIRARLGFKQGPPGPPMEHKGSNSEIPHFWVYCFKSAKRILIFWFFEVVLSLAGLSPALRLGSLGHVYGYRFQTRRELCNGSAPAP